MYALVTEVSREERCALFDTVHDPTSPRTYSPLRTNVSCQSQPSSVRVIPVPHSTESGGARDTANITSVRLYALYPRTSVTVASHSGQRDADRLRIAHTETDYVTSSSVEELI